MLPRHISTLLDDVFAAKVDGNTRYLQRDVVGSVRMITDYFGGVVGTTSYSQFGKVQTSTGSNDTGLGYTSRPTDTGTGLVDLRARMFDPNLGRFLGRDPVSTLGMGLSLYQYANNQPLVFVDLTGRTATVGASRSSIAGQAHPAPSSVNTARPYTEMPNQLTNVGTAVGWGGTVSGWAGYENVAAASGNIAVGIGIVSGSSGPIQTIVDWGTETLSFAAGCAIAGGPANPVACGYVGIMTNIATSGIRSELSDWAGGLDKSFGLTSNGLSDPNVIWRREQERAAADRLWRQIESQSPKSPQTYQIDSINSYYRLP